MKQLNELSDETIKQYVERAKQVRAELQAHQGEYRGIRDRMIQRKDRGIERAEKRQQKSIRESEEKRWVVYVDRMAVAHYSTKQEAVHIVNTLKSKYGNVTYSIRYEYPSDSTKLNQKEIKNAKR